MSEETKDMIDMIIDNYNQIAFQKFLDIEVVKADREESIAHVKLPFKKELAGGGKAYHGGVISSLIDLTGALATWVGHDVNRGMKASTVQLNVQFLAAALGQDIVAEAKVTKRGKDLNFVDVNVYTEDRSKHVAHGTMVYRIAA